MSFTTSGLPLALTITFVVLVLLPTQTYAFGAGEIPDFSYLDGSAFRHGDIENILTEVAKAAAHSGGGHGGGILGFAKKLVDKATDGKNFARKDIKRIYFGNWLRDFSQALDIAGLSKLTAESLVMVVSVLGFMEFGYATEEYEVTRDRLGVYLPVEHIDNPKGYAEKEGDARQFDKRLRPPVEDRELEIDERTGMKKYMATEDEGFDSSTAHIKRVLRGAIEHYHKSGGDDDSPDLHEAYRLMGTGLHTLEDLLAHSNWIELGLRKMGHQDVFCHVGDQVLVRSPSGDEVPPLITGTFGSADFMHSMLGEATDKLSQTSVTALTEKMNTSQSANGNLEMIRNIISKIPKSDSGDEEEKVNQGQEMEEKSKAYDFNPDDIAPKEVQDQLMQLLRWRDGLMRDIERQLEKIPGLTELVDQFALALNEYVYTLLSPYVVPILEQVTTVIGEGSKEIIEAHDDQTEVFENPHYSDPSHSMLSKDHFGLILNEPAGKIAQIVVIRSVETLVRAFQDEGCDIDRVLDEVLEAFHHPYWATGNSSVQKEMFEELDKWIGGQGHSGAEEIIQKLTKDAVREGKNKRADSEGNTSSGGGGHSHGGQQSSNQQSGGGSYGSGGGYGSSGGGQNEYGGDSNSGGGGGYGGQHHGGGGREEQQTYASGGEYGSGGNSGRNEYESSGRNEESGYGGGGGGRSNYEEGNRPFGSGGSGHYGSDERTGINDSGGYAPRRDEEDSGNYGQNQGREESYGGGREESYGGGRQESYGGGRHESYGGGREESYGGGHSESRGEGYGESHGGGQRYGGGREESYGGGGEDRYGGGREENSYGGGRGDDNYGGERHHQQSYGGGDEGGERRHHGGGGGGGYGGREESSGGYEPSYERRDEDSYGGREEGYGGGGHQSGSYGGDRQEGYGRRDEDLSGGFDRMGLNDTGGYAPREDQGYGGGENVYEEERRSRRGDEYEESGY